jgi:hypothetical protein
MSIKSLFFFGALALFAVGCEDEAVTPTLEVPTTYTSTDFDANVVAENTVVDELATMTAAANAAEANAQSVTVAPIDYPTTLAAVTLPTYRPLVEDWLVELVNSANSPTGFQNPGLNNSPAPGEEGGLLGTRLLDENGLELEQMIQKGSFGAALYNHALTVINGDLSSSAAIDKLVEIHGADVNFNPATTTAAATYSRRRSDLEAQTGFFYDIRNSLLTAKAAIEQGGFEAERDQALADYLLAWEKSNFATVIYYCQATKVMLQDAAGLTEGTQRAEMLGNAMHAYAEGVAFAHGFRGINQKQITDAEIDQILALFLAPEGQTPESHRFLNEATLLANLDQAIDLIQGIYGFTDAEVTSFFVNNNP